MLVFRGVGPKVYHDHRTHVSKKQLIIHDHVPFYSIAIILTTIILVKPGLLFAVSNSHDVSLSISLLTNSCHFTWTFTWDFQEICFVAKPRSHPPKTTTTTLCCFFSSSFSRKNTKKNPPGDPNRCPEGKMPFSFFD